MVKSRGQGNQALGPAAKEDPALIFCLRYLPVDVHPYRFGFVPTSKGSCLVFLFHCMCLHIYLSKFCTHRARHPCYHQISSSRSVSRSASTRILKGPKGTVTSSSR